MNRRGFLRALGALAAVPVLGRLAKAALRHGRLRVYPPDQFGGDCLHIGLSQNGKEVSYAGYARARVGRTDKDWKVWYDGAADLWRTTNLRPIAFSAKQAGRTWIDGFAVYDSRGACLYEGSTFFPISIGAGDTALFDSRSILITEERRGDA